MTAFKPGLTVRAIRPVIAGLEALGHSVDSLLAEAGMPASILADLDGYLPAGSSRKLWERAVAKAKDDCLGIHVAMAAPVNAFDVHAYAMLSSPTLSGALYRVCRYQRLINEGTELTLEDDGGDGALRHGLLGGGAVSRQPAEFLAVTWLRLGRMVTGTAWSPAQVFFAHDRPADTRPHEEIFGVRPNFGSGFTAMRIPAALVATPLPTPVSYPLGLALSTTLNLAAAELWIRHHRTGRRRRKALGDLSTAAWRAVVSLPLGSR